MFYRAAAGPVDSSTARPDQDVLGGASWNRTSDLSIINDRMDSFRFEVAPHDSALVLSFLPPFSTSCITSAASATGRTRWR